MSPDAFLAGFASALGLHVTILLAAAGWSHAKRLLK